LSTAPCFWLAKHNDSSRWFAISSCHLYAFQFYEWSSKKLNLDVKIIFARPHTKHWWGCSVGTKYLPTS
jgi:hypothetical protein